MTMTSRAIAAVLSMALASAAGAARVTGKCGSEPNAGVFLYGMSQQTQDALYAAAMSPNSNPDLAWALWEPLSASSFTSVLGNRSVVLNVDPFQDVQEIVASMRADGMLASLGIGSIEVNSYACGVPPPLPHVRVTEYHNVLLDHYFLSSSDTENAMIEQGSAGPGWERTGESFLAAVVVACPALKKVFRFYAPSSRSHFFTVDAEECGGLRKQGTGWIAEGVAFGATMPVNGACVPGETALYRLYNNRWMYNDSNHRYTLRGDVYRQMIDRGWIGEGVAMCIREGP
jgi:hypothetical protein